MNYYNEWDADAAAWLRQLILEGLIPPGDVDTRSIREVSASDIRDYTQCHFFAGIGGWSLALELAGVAQDRPLWTGSCPCQPFSAAGNRKGTEDERHLWPEFQRLIGQCKPPVVFGEQVASKDGRLWLSTVRADLEAMGYAVGAADLCAAGIGAPHIRQRLFWVANSDSAGLDQLSPSRLHERRPGKGSGESTQESADGSFGHNTAGCSAHGGLVNGKREGLEGQRRGHYAEVGQREGQVRSIAETGESGGLAYRGRPGPAYAQWGDADWLFCRDGKWRPVEPRTFPLAHGIPARVGRLRGYGNGIVPQVAATFIEAFEDCLRG